MKHLFFPLIYSADYPSNIPVTREQSPLQIAAAQSAKKNKRGKPKPRSKK